MWHTTIPRTALIALGCGAFLVGLGIASTGVQTSVWLVALSACLLLCTLRRRLIIALPAVIIAGLLFGWWRGGVVQTELSPYKHLQNQSVTATGTVLDDPTYDDKGQLDFRITKVLLDSQALPGTIRVKSFSPLSINRGDTITVSGTLRDGFGNYQAALYFAEVTIISQNNDPLDAMRRQFAAAVLTALPEPQASLGLGFVLGLKTSLPDNLSDSLRILGLTHIVVASGFNLTVLIRLARRFFAKYSKFQTLFFASGLLWGFVAITGFSPSMSRAALVTGLTLAAWYFGRRIHPIVILLLAAGLTAAINPLFLWSDIGWWLSFLAFAGVLLIAPLLQERLFGNKQVHFIPQIIIETIAAQLMVTPFILWLFGDLAVISLLANVLVVPIIPLCMALVFLVGLSSLVVPAVGAIIALPTTWLLTYITEVTRWLSGIPWATISLPIALVTMLGCYGIISFFAIILWRKTKYHYLKKSVIE